MHDHAQSTTGDGWQTVLGWLDRLLEAATVLLLLSASGLAAVQVFCRYVLNASLPWPEELAQWAFGWAVFLGMALLTGRNSHITIGFLARLMPVGLQRAQAHFSRAIVAATSIMLIVHGMDFIGRVMQVSPALEWPMRYLFLAVPVGGALNIVMLFFRARTSALNVMAAIAAGGLLYLAVRFGAPQVFGQAQSASVLMIAGIGLIFLEVPIAFALIFGSFLAIVPMGMTMLITVSQNMSSSMNSFTLLAIPFFVMAAAVMNAGGMTVRLVDLATHLVGHFRGGLGQANVVTNTLLAGVSGSSTADASAIAKLMVPEMEKRGYDRAFGCALTSASSTLANLIPPSLGLIIYAALASVSVGALFVATIVPGLLTAAALSVVVYFVSKKKGYGGDMPRSTGKQRIIALGYAVPALLLPVFIVGGVRFGVFTATEAGAMAFIFALLCGGLIYRCLTRENFIAAAREAASDTIAVSIIIAAAAPFAWILAFQQVPQKLAAALTDFSSNAIVLLLIINIFLLFVGLFMEMIAAMVILVPILVPVIMKVGVDPVQFGIVLVLNLVIGALTPPLGMLVFTTARVGRADVADVFRAVVPFIGAMIIVLALITFIPQLSLGPLKFFGP